MRNLGLGLGFVLRKKRLDPQTVITVNRIKNIAGYGYVLTPAQITQLNTRYKAMRANGGIPALWHDAELSVNKNLFVYTEDISQSNWGLIGTATRTGTNILNTPAANDGISQQISCPAGKTINGLTYTISAYLSGTPGQTIRVALRDSLSALPSRESADIVLTATPTRYSFTYAFVSGETATGVTGFIRRLSGTTATSVTVSKLQLEQGATLSQYYPRLDLTSPKSLNLGTAGVSGDMTFTNGTSSTMVDISNSRKVYNALGSSNQSLVSGLNGVTGNADALHMLFLNRADTATSIVVFGHGVTSDFRGLQSTISGNGTVGVYRSIAPDSSTVNATIIGNSVWNSQTGQIRNNTNRDYYVTGANKQSSSSVTVNTVAANPVRAFSVAGFAAYTGLANHFIYDTKTRTDAQVLALHNLLKGDVGL